MSNESQPINGLYPSHYEYNGGMYVVQGEDGAIFTKNSLKINTMVYKTVTVGTTPVEVKVGSSALANRFAVIIQNLDSSVNLYIGNNDVNSTTGNGYVVFPKGTATLDNLGDISIYIVAASEIQVVIGFVYC